MFKLYRKYLPRYAKEVILGPMFKLIEAIFELIVPLIIASIIDVGVANGDKAYIYKMGGILIALAIVGLCSTLVCQVFGCRASQGFGTAVRNDLYKHINSLSFKEIDEIGTASLITRMTSDINQVQTSVAMLIRLVVRAPFLVIGSAIMAFLISPKIALVFIGVAILISVVIFIIMRFSIPINKRAQKKLDDITVITKENLTGSRVIRAFSKQQYEEERFYKSSTTLEKILVKVGKIGGLLNPLSFVIVNLGIVLVIYLGGFEVNVGKLTQGNILSLANYMNQILLAIIVVANLVITFTKASACSARINEIFALQSSVVNNGKEELDKIESIEFKNVSFKYSDCANYVVENINFKIKKGQTVGIIGGTGSGKSTLINLLSRFYDTQEGDISFNSSNVRNYNIHQLRKKIGIVPQKSVLFYGSILDNLCVGNENATTEEINTALEISQAKEFVQHLENKTDTILYQGGKNLSGGQRQRLCIARALVQNPEVIILDDSSSALDLKTDYLLREALKKWLRDEIIIIVSQRATSIKNSDLILVMDDGRIVGTGTHEELLSNCKIYQEICESQIPEEKGETL